MLGMRAPDLEVHVLGDGQNLDRVRAHVAVDRKRHGYDHRPDV